MILLLGWLGFLLTLIAYAGVVTKRLKPDANTYGYLNLISALFCGLTAANARVWSIVALNVVWGIIATCGLVNSEDRHHRHESPAS